MIPRNAKELSGAIDAIKQGAIGEKGFDYILEEFYAYVIENKELNVAMNSLFIKDFRNVPNSSYCGRARTVDKNLVTQNHDGLKAYGAVHEDYYYWVNSFFVEYDNGHYIFGDFEKVIFASSEATYDKFIEDFGYNEWDYGDI